MVRMIFWASLVVFSVGTASLAGAQQSPQLSDEELASALAVESSAIEQFKGGAALAPMAAFTAEAIPELQSTPAGVEGKSVVTGVTAVSSQEAAQVSRAVVTRYDYGTGLTFRTLVDLAAKQALEVKADANFPTPLAPQEVERAIEIAGGTVPEIGQPPGAAQSEPRLLPIINTLRTSPTYGHRLVVVWRDDLPRVERVLVDLTTETVADPNY